MHKYKRKWQEALLPFSFIVQGAKPPSNKVKYTLYALWR